MRIYPKNPVLYESTYRDALIGVWGIEEKAVFIAIFQITKQYRGAVQVKSMTESTVKKNKQKQH